MDSQLASSDKCKMAGSIELSKTEDSELKDFLEHVKESEKPKLTELLENVVPKKAAYWKTMGFLLNLSSGELDTIEHDYRKAMDCCREMFHKWLDVDCEATWGKLKEIFKSPAMLCKPQLPNGVRKPGICDHQANLIFCIARIFALSWKVLSGALSIPSHVINDIYAKEKNPVLICEKLVKYWFETTSGANEHVFLELVNQPYLQDDLKQEITLLQANVNGKPVSYPDFFPRPIAEAYTCMIVKVIKILKKFPNAHEDILLHLRYYPNKIKVNNELFENTKDASEIVDILINEGMLSPINVSKLLFLVKSIECQDAEKVIESYESSIEDKPIADELMWCLGQCQSPDRCYLYARLIEDPKIVTYRDLKNAKAAVSKCTNIPIHNMDEERIGKGSTFIFWKISEEDANKLQLSKVLPLSLQQLLCHANIIELGLCYKEKQESVAVNKLAIVAINEDTYLQQAINDLRKSYIKSRFYHTSNEWPLYHPKHYTTLAYIQHKGSLVNHVQLISITEELVYKRNLYKNQPSGGNISYHSKNISDLFPNDLVSSYTLLIEGAPGIGKTVLSKKIACQWAENKLLKFKKLVFLLFLNDPNIRCLSSLNSLVQYLFKSTEIASGLTDHLIQTNGKCLTIIFDGYDEISEEERNHSLVAAIICRNILPECDMVITSRPTASLHLRDMADCRVEVLGFTEKDRLDYIQHSLKGSDNKIKSLHLYLQSNSTINALCYVPLNMTILLCLFEEIKCLSGDSENKEELELPNTQTELYETFILMTITRFIKKTNKSFTGQCLKKIYELPEPYNKVFSELLHLAYNALTRDEIVFNLNDEVVQACPILKSGNWEGLGLLKVTEYVNKFSFHFLHFSIQEYLAAYYIASQSPKFQIQLLKATFWDTHYFNTWMMYVGLTGGEKIAWKHFISGNWFMISTKLFKSFKISKRYLNDKIKSLHLFQCFAEIRNEEVYGKIFIDRAIDLSNQTLLPRDINTICSFLLRSLNKHWVKLDLSNCNIGDTGSDILCKAFLGKNRGIVCISQVNLSYNHLQAHSILGLLDVLKIWHTSMAVIYEDYDNDCNAFELCLEKISEYNDEAFSQTVVVGPFVFAHNVDIHNQLINLTKITGLYLNSCSYPSTNSAYKELSHKLSLSRLHILGENIPCHFIEAIVRTIKVVHSVYIYDHTLSDEDVRCISLLLHKINLNNLGVWLVIGGTKILGNIPDLFALNKWLSSIEIFNLAESIKRLYCNSSMGLTTMKFSKCCNLQSQSRSLFEDIFYLLHENIYKCEIKFCLIEKSHLIANKANFDEIKEVLSLNTNLNSIFLSKCELNLIELSGFINLISKQVSLERLHFFHIFSKMNIFSCESLLNQPLRLKEVFIHNTSSCCALTFDLFAAQRDYPNVSIVLITNNTLIGLNPTSKQILLSLQLDVTLKIWKICNFSANTELIQQINNTLLSNVMELDIMGCILGNNKSKQSVTHYKINVCQDIESTGNILSHFTKLFGFTFCHNDLQEADSGKIFKNLNTTSLTKINISHNAIHEEAVNDIAKFLSQSPKLKDIDLSCNNFQVIGTAKLLRALQNKSNLTRINFSNTYITEKESHVLAALLSCNAQLKELDLSHNNLGPAGAITVFKGMNDLQSLIKLNVSNNNISDEATGNIAVILFQNDILKELDLSYNYLGAFGSLRIFRSMKKISNLIKLNVCAIGITNIAADDIATVLNNNIKLQELDLSHNHIQAEGANIIFKKTKSTVNLHKFNISYNNITGNMNSFKKFLTGNTKLEELDLSHNNLQTAGIITVCRANILKLKKFDISYNNITDDAADHIAQYLYHNTNLQMLNVSGNDLQKLGCRNIFKKLQVISHLCSLKVSHVCVSNEAADELANVLLHNTSLQELDLSYNNPSTSDAVKILNGMRNLFNLKTINFSHNMMGDEAADMLANVLLKSTKLKKIKLKCNNLSTSNAIKVFNGMKNILNLEAINVSHNMITDEAADNIAIALSNNHKLNSLNLSCNYFRSTGVAKILKGCFRYIMYLRKLNISGNEITAKAACSIATVLSHNLKLEKLDLSNNFMQEAGATIIFKNLRHISTLKKLYINDNMIGDEAANDIALVLSQNTKLEVLDISSNRIQTIGIVKIFQSIKHISTLTKLNIAYTTLTDEATKHILDALSNKSKLRELNLSHTNLKNTIVLKGLKFLNLTKFNFSGNNIDKRSAIEILDIVRHCTNLQVLDLSCTNQQIADNINRLNTCNIKKLDLSGNGIITLAGSKIAVLLSKNGELEELDLSCNNLQELGIRNILKSINVQNLINLNINNNHITSDLKYLGNILIKAGKLVKLDLSHNKVVADHMRSFLYKTKLIFANLIQLNLSGIVINDNATEALADVLRENNKLNILHLSDNNLNTERVGKIFNGLKISTLLKFIISHNNITDEGADYIAMFLSRNIKLEELDVSHNNLLSAGAIKVCSINLKNIVNINMSHNSITVEAANNIAIFLSRNKKLQKLDLSHNSLLYAGAKLICETDLSNLTAFNICCNNITIEEDNDLADFLSHNTKLQVLDLSCNDFPETTSVKAFKVLQDLSVLTSLKLSNCNVNGEAVDELALFLLSNTSLQEINLSGNNLSESDTAKIFRGMKNISNLVSMNVSHNVITDEAADELAKDLCNNSLLQELDLSYTSLSISDAVKILKGMKNISKLVSMNISHNTITDEAADDLAAVLLTNTSLKDINLSCIQLSTLGAINIFKGMKNVSNLTALDISYNMISDEAAKNIATVLFHNDKLQSLDLSSNYFRSQGFVKIFHGLRDNVCLRNLNISCNEILTTAACSIATVLSHNSILEELDLGNNFMQSAGTITIFKCLRHNSNLNKICIPGNMITDEAADDIADVLFHTNNLQIFDISSNFFSSEGCIKIINGMKNISYLKQFDIGYNQITCEAADSIGTLVSHNSELEELVLSCNDIYETNLFKRIETVKLTKLDIRGNNLTHLMADDIADVLICNNKLESINMSGNEFLSEGITTIFHGMKNILNLTQIDISQNGITYEAASDIAIVLSQNSNLQELNLSNNYLQTSGIITILSRMSTNSKITHLDISSNKITDEAADDIATFLHHNKNLKILDLSCNPLQATGVATIFGRTNAKFSLKKLNLSDNALDDEAADTIAAFLMQSPFLEDIDVSKNCLQSVGAVKIFQAIRSFPNIVKLNISNNNITDETANKIEDFYQQSLNLRS